MSADNEPETILVVDDSKSITDMVKIYLEKNEYAVLTAGDGQEGFRCACDNDVQLIVLDLMMPLQDGWDTIRALKKAPKTRDIPIIVLSARTSADDADRCFDMGIDRYISKPFSLKTLTERIKETIRKHQERVLEQAARRMIGLCGRSCEDCQFYMIKCRGCTTENELKSAKFQCEIYKCVLASRKDSCLKCDQMPKCKIHLANSTQCPNVK